MMTFQEFKQYCLTKPGVYEDYPFDFTTMVMRLGSRMFALTDVKENPLRITLKCEPLFAQNLREQYSAIIPGYHLNKQHWNTLNLDGTLPNKLIRELIDHSYQQVFNSLTKAQKKEISG